MKTLILNTVPISGTHTAFWLFHTLGGIPTYWDHFEPGTRRLLDSMREAVSANRDEFVMVQTTRSEASLARSYASNKDPAVTQAALTECLRARAELRDAGYPCDFVLPIEASNEMRTEIALEIFDACGVEPPAEAKEFMETWTKLGKKDDKFKGFNDASQYGVFRATLKQSRTHYFLTGERNGT